jgi:hypothetical protein
MTEQGFKNACAAQRQELADKRRGRVGRYIRMCDVCKGEQVPAEVEFTALDALLGEVENKEDVMGKRRDVGTCEQCQGKERPLYLHAGKMCCASCKNMRTVAKNNPETVVVALKEFHGDGYFAGGDLWTTEQIEELVRSQSSLHIIIDYLHPEEGGKTAEPESFLELVNNAQQIVQGLDMAYETERALREKTWVLADAVALAGMDTGAVPVAEYINGLDCAYEIEARRVAILVNQMDIIRQTLGLAEGVSRGETVGKARGAADDLEEAVAALGEIGAAVGMDGESYADIIDAVAVLSSNLQRHKNNNQDLHTSNGLLQDLLDEKTKEIAFFERQLKTTAVVEPFEMDSAVLPFPVMSIDSFDRLHDLLWLLKGMVITGNANGPGQQHVNALDEVVGKSAVLGEAA